MLSTLAPARRRLVLGVIGLLVVGLLVLLGVVLVPRLQDTAVADQAEPGPVVLVPGYGGDLDSLEPLAAQVRREGRTAVVFKPSAGGTGDLPTQARRLGDVVQRAMDAQGAHSVDIVGYSAGGVIARLFIRDEGGASVVRRVLTIGSPQHGTDVAALAKEVVGSCPVACEQLATDSDLIRGLNAGDETPAGPRWVTVRSTSDTVVTPTDSAALDGAVNVVVQDVCPGTRTSHGALPDDPVVLAVLQRAIATPVPAAEPGYRVSC